MSKPSSAHPKKLLSYRKPAPLTRVADSLALAEGALPQLDILWHYDCVVSPHSHAYRPCSSGARPQGRSASPLSHAAGPRLDAIDLQSAPSSLISSCSTVAEVLPSVSARSPAAMRPLSSSSHPPLSDHHRRALQRVFSTFDQNGDGSVSTQEISRIFEKLGFSQTEYSIESLLAGLVTKSPGHVDEQEFLSLYQSIASSDANTSESADVDEDLLAAFHVFDKDGNGFISPAELQSVLCSLGFSQARQLDACVDMIARVDENGDGQVDFFEFKKLFLFENPFMMISSF